MRGVLLYSAVLLVGCGGGSGKDPAPAPQPIAVSVSPISATVFAGGSQAFSATVTGTINKAVTLVGDLKPGHYAVLTTVIPSFYWDFDVK